MDGIRLWLPIIAAQLPLQLDLIEAAGHYCSSVINTFLERAHTLLRLGNRRREVPFVSILEMQGLSHYAGHQRRIEYDPASLDMVSVFAAALHEALHELPSTVPPTVRHAALLQLTVLSQAV